RPRDGPWPETGGALSSISALASSQWRGPAVSCPPAGERPTWVPTYPARIIHAYLLERSPHPHTSQAHYHFFWTAAITWSRLQLRGCDREAAWAGDPLQLEWDGAARGAPMSQGACRRVCGASRPKPPVAIERVTPHGCPDA